MKVFKSIKWNISILRNNKNLLKSGIYVLHPNLRTFIRLSFRSNDNINLPITPIKGFKFRLMGIVRIFFTQIVLSRKSEFNGEVVYLSNTPDLDKREIKVFNLQSNEVYVKLQDRHTYNNFISLYNKVSDKFNVPEVIDFNNDILSYTLRFIRNKTDIVYSDIIIENLLSFYNQYYHQNNPTHIEIINEDAFHRVGISPYYKDYRHSLFLHHGDLSRDNLIFSHDDDVFLIDFEHADNYPPYYDIFYYLVNTMVHFDKEKINIQNIVSKYAKEFSYETKGMLFYFELYVLYFYSKHSHVFNPKYNYNNVIAHLYNCIIQFS